MLASPVTSNSTESPQNAVHSGHACVLCQQRKVKCNKEIPCSNCTKSKAECVYAAPVARKRRKKGNLSDNDLHGKVRKYEPHSQSETDHKGYARQSYGEKIDVVGSASRGTFLQDEQGSRYVEHPMWVNMKSEMQERKLSPLRSIQSENGKLDYSEPGFLLLSNGCATKDIEFLHPEPANMLRLWHAFLANVHPLVMMFHAPTVQNIVLDASNDATGLSSSYEAFLFAIYLLAVTSLKDEECMEIFREPRDVLSSRYSFGTQQALINAKFVKSSSLTTLQAFTLFLIAVRKTYDPHAFLVLTGSAVRIAQRLGLHRDGSYHDLPPFETEIRRRTWWEVFVLDTQALKMTGAGLFRSNSMDDTDTKLPLNINDSDLNPNMTMLPVNKEGPSDMMACCLRFDILKRPWGLMRQYLTGNMTNGQVAERDNQIQELQQYIYNKYLIFCDPSIPLHYLTICMATSFICMMKISAHHPRQYPDNGASMPQGEKDMLFEESLKFLQHFNASHTNQSLSKFIWNAQVHITMEPFIYLLSELAQRPFGEIVDRAWHEVETMYECQLELLEGIQNKLYAAVGTLVLKAWENREAGTFHKQNVNEQALEPPKYIQILRLQRNISPITSAMSVLTESNGHAGSGRHVSYDEASGNANIEAPLATTESNLNILDMEAQDWEYWQTLMDAEMAPFVAPFIGE